LTRENPVRVVFDISLMEQTPGIVGKSGVVRTAEELAKELQQRREVDLKFSGFRHWQSMTAIEKIVHSDARWSTPVARGPSEPLGSQLMHTLGRIAWRVPRLRPWCHSIESSRQERLSEFTLPLNLSDVDVLHTPFYPIPQHIRERRKTENFALLTMVHDLIPLRLPGYGDPTNPHYQMVRRMVDSFDEEDWVVCDSQYTRQDLLNESIRLDPKRVFVTPLAAADIFVPTESSRQDLLGMLFGKHASSETIFFVSLCSIEPRKNIETVVAAFDRLTRMCGADVRLVLIGVTTNAGTGVFNVIAKLPSRDRIHYVGALPDDLLPAVYSASIGFLYLSVYEGFGLPPLEAMRCGTPTITSNATSLPEVVGDAGISVEPMDAEAVSEHMLRLVEDEELRSRLSAAGLQRSRQFTWCRTVDKTMEVYRAAAASLA
jgi:glycosyltransferase involved in cell wall biosynthesis